MRARVGSVDMKKSLSSGKFNRGAMDLLDIKSPRRADHIVTEIYEWIQFSRAIINTRDEPLADYTKYRRLHLLVGDSNMSEYAAALKVGTTFACPRPH